MDSHGSILVASSYIGHGCSNGIIMHMMHDLLNARAPLHFLLYKSPLLHHIPRILTKLQQPAWTTCHFFVPKGADDNAVMEKRGKCMIIRVSHYDGESKDVGPCAFIDILLTVNSNCVKKPSGAALFWQT
ncbi:hypothetical protein SUGI_0151980 [Cryptomeria japonica]|nr:hypothetical protein SUGI_0151980 [Cryptomeria japonica]